MNHSNKDRMVIAFQFMEETGVFPKAAFRDEENLYTKPQKKWTFFNIIILYEIHHDDCKCSYCYEFHGTVGIALPENKARNSWRILWWRKNKQLNILRGAMA